MIINLLNELCGARLTFNYMRVGGVKWDAPDGWIEKVEEFVPYMREQLAGYHDLVSGNEIFLNRVKGVGIYSEEDAISYSLSGANLRCTGVNWDLRKDEPYPFTTVLISIFLWGAWGCLGSLRLPHEGN